MATNTPPNIHRILKAFLSALAAIPSNIKPFLGITMPTMEADDVVHFRTAFGFWKYSFQ